MPSFVRRSRKLQKQYQEPVWQLLQIADGKWTLHFDSSGEELKKGSGSIIIGEGGWYVVNLYNSADIPARPGRLDF